MKTKISIVVTGILLAACSSKGGWIGAEAEKKYDKDLAAARAAEVRNSDDYYEYHRDNEILVLADAKDLKVFLTANEIPLRVTKIAAGPNGERLVFALMKSEAKAMEKQVGYKGGAQQLYEGTTVGSDKGFYAEVFRDGRYHVFTEWSALQAFRAGGRPAVVSTATAADGKPVVFATSSAEAMARFSELHAR